MLANRKALVATVEIDQLSDKPDVHSSMTIQERFEIFHAEHPEVYVYLSDLISELRHQGWQHYGINSLWERARWRSS